MVDRVRFAVVGVGDFGQKRVKAIVKSDVAELLYVVDMDEEKAESAAMDTGGSRLLRLLDLMSEIKACRLYTCLNLSGTSVALRNNCVAIYDLADTGMTIVRSEHQNTANVYITLIPRISP